MEKEQFLLQMSKMEKLDNKNYNVNNQFKKGITDLLSMKFSNSHMKYLDPMHFEIQESKTFLKKNEKGKLEINYSDENKNCFYFYGIDHFSDSKRKTQFLKNKFKKIFEDYIEYANYLNSIINSEKKNK